MVRLTLAGPSRGPVSVAPGSVEAVEPAGENTVRVRLSSGHSVEVLGSVDEVCKELTPVPDFE
jgi:hypothetical protein